VIRDEGRQRSEISLKSSMLTRGEGSRGTCKLIPG